MDNNAREAARALLIGGSAADAERLAASMSDAGQVIAFATDRASADRLKHVFARHRITAAVMLGDPALLVHKVTGPFHVIVDAHPGHAQRRERLRGMLAAQGRLVPAAEDHPEADHTHE